MALLKAKKNSIPGDAVILSENDALKYQLNILKNWKHSGDMYVLHLFNYSIFKCYYQ